MSSESAGASASVPRLFRFVFLGVLLLGLISWGVTSGIERIIGSLPSNDTRPVEVGTRAPDFKLTSLDGPDISLSSQRGNVVILNFWATWCGPCRAEMPTLEKVGQTYRDRGLRVIGVDVQESPDKVRDFLPEVGVTFPIVFDSDTALARRYRAGGLPASFIIDREGTVREIKLGAYTEETLIEKIQPLIGGVALATGAER
jgi:peroxiredoxin